MIESSTGQGGVTSKPLKRPLFKKPAWANAALGVDGDLFHRSAHTYINSAAELERKIHRKAARREKERLRKFDNGNRSTKRRRISDDQDNDESAGSDHDLSQSSDSESGISMVGQTHSSNLKPRSPSTKSSLVQQYESQTEEARAVEEEQRKTRPADVIDLEEDSAGDDIAAAPKHMHAEVPILEPSKHMAQDLSYDEEFPELARKAREKARRKRLEQDCLSPSQNHRAIIDVEHPRIPNNSLQSTSLLPPPEPTLHILITSTIKDTRSLIVNRKLSQRLKDVRLAWAERQGFSKDFAESIFLTWKGKRLFDVTSCKSLGISVDAGGFIAYKGDVLGVDEGRLHLEAMTPKIFKRFKRAKEDEQTGEENEGAADEASFHVPPKAGTQVRIILKGKGLDDFKLIVKPVSIHTSVASTLLTCSRTPSYRRSSMLFAVPIAYRPKARFTCCSMVNVFLISLELKKQRSRIWTISMFISSRPSSNERI